MSKYRDNIGHYLNRLYPKKLLQKTMLCIESVGYNFRKKININSQINSINSAKTIAIYPLYDIIIGDGYGYSISSRSVGSKGVCPWGKHLGYALLPAQKCAPALARIVAES